MPYPVRYRCPRCGTVVTLQRAGYLADRSVTPYPLEGWTYAEVGVLDDGAEGVSASGASGGSSNRRFDGVRIVCGEGESGGGERSGASRFSSDRRSDGGERTEGSRVTSDVPSDGGEPNEGNAVGVTSSDVPSDGTRRTSSDERSESGGAGCGEPFYLSFVRFEDGREVDPEPEPEHVELAPDRPRGPRWPGGPGR